MVETLGLEQFDFFSTAMVLCPNEKMHLRYLLQVDLIHMQIQVYVDSGSITEKHQDGRFQLVKTRTPSLAACKNNEHDEDGCYCLSINGSYGILTGMQPTNRCHLRDLFNSNFGRFSLSSFMSDISWHH